MMPTATITEPARQLQVADQYDVIVCGGGTAGIPAAIAAARSGARTALFERYGFVGGVAAYSIMPCWHTLETSHTGLLTEFAQRIEAFGHGPAPLKDGNHIEPETVKVLGLKMLLEAGVALHLHNYLAAPVMEGNRVTGVITESKSGRRAFLGKALVDTTGDGDLAAMAGADFEFGRQGRDGFVQGVTLRFRIGHIDFDRYFDWVATKPDYYPAVHRKPENLNRLREQARQGKAFYMPGHIDELFNAHRDEFPDMPPHTYFNVSSIRRNELSINATRLYGIDGTREEDLSKAEVTTRLQAFAIWQCLRKYVPGFEQSLIVDVGAQVGVRETRRIIGDYMLTEADCRRNAEFEDSVLTTHLSFDLHDVKGYSCEGIRGLADVPYRCFLPKGVEGLLVAGRCASTDHVANSAYRLQTVAYMSGQVVGTAAAMSAAREITPRALPVIELKARLRADGFKTSQADRYADREEIFGRRRSDGTNLPLFLDTVGPGQKAKAIHIDLPRDKR